MAATHETIGLTLVRNGTISRPQLYDALRLQRQNGRLLGTCLVELGYMSADGLLNFLSAQLGVPVGLREQLMHADRRALGRLSSLRARALPALPFGWQGRSLRLAVADGDVINRLPELEIEARCAIAPHVVLEKDLLEALSHHYPPRSVAAAFESELHPRSASYVSDASLLTADRTSEPSPFRSAVLPRKTSPPTGLPLERIGLYDAVERVFEAENLDEIGRCVGRALLNYFARVVVLRVGIEQCVVVGYAGVTPQYSILGPDQFVVPQGLNFAYGWTEEVVGAASLASALRLGRAPTALLADYGLPLLFYADHEVAGERYDDLRDVEMLLNEAASATRILKP